MFVSQIIDEASEILATTDQTKIFRKLTQAVQILMESGHYFHTNSEVDVCTGWDGQTITLPRGIEVPLGVNVDGSPQYFRGRLFQYHVNKGGMYNPVSWAWDDRGFVSTIMDIREPSQLIAVAEHQSDAGLKLRVVGTDGNNRELRSQDDNGAGIDGLVIPVHAQSDFPYGTIQPDGVTIATRSASVSPITEFTSGSTAHNFSNGQKVLLALASGLVPSPLINGNNYYAGIVDNYTIQLYQSALDAQNNTNPIGMQSIVGATAGGITLTDSRPINLLTCINLQSVPAISLSSPNEVTFSTATGGSYSGVLPSPLVANTTYFTQNLDSTNLQVFGSYSDALNNINPVYLSGNSGEFNVNLRSPMAPVTTLTFSIPHYFSTGDVVQAFTAGGTLPLPLIAGQNYYVYVLTPTSVTIHTNPADAVSGVNPITLTTAGSGTNSLVKLIPATANIGQTSNITASGLSVNSPSGSGAAASAVVVGSVTGITITSGGTGYTTPPLVQFSPPPNPPVNTNQQFRTATGYATIVSGAVTAITITDGGLGYSGAPTISFIGANTTGATANASITLSFVSSFNIVSGGSGYTTPPAVKITGAGSGATAIASISNGQVTSINVVTQGSGYATAPVVSITPSTGVFIQFSSTGTLPSPLVAGTTYIAQPPLNAASGTFSVVDQFFNPVNITSNGTGTFYVQLSRAFSIGFNNQWEGTFSGLTNGQLVQFGSDYLFPTLSPASSSGYIALISNTLAKFYSTQAEATANFPITNIKVTSGGVNYSLVPSVAITGGSGTFTTAPTATIERTITSTNIISGGYGYITPPSVTITGSGATAKATASVGLISTLSSGYISGTTLHVTAYPTQTNILSVGMSIIATNTSTGIPSGTYITALGTGTGGVGTYTINNSVTFASSGSPQGITGLANGITAVNLVIGSQSGPFATAPVVTIDASPNGVTATATSTINGSGIITGFTITGQGSGYTSIPSVTFIGGGYTSQATAGASVLNGSISSIGMILAGAGYTAAPSVQIGTPWSVNTQYSIGQQVYFGSYLYTCTAAGSTLGSGNGTPTPANPNNGTDSDLFFSYAGTIATAVANTCYVSSISVPSGTLGYSTLPTITITPASGDTTGTGATAIVVDNAITTLTLGVGQAYYAVQQPAYAKAYIPAGNLTNGASLLAPSTNQLLNDGTLVTFQSSSYVSGATDSGLPYPLTHGTQYQIKNYGADIYLYDSTGTTPIVFVNGSIPTLANGTLTMNHAVSFTPVPSSTLSVPNSTYDTGVQVMVRANTNDTLPSALIGEATSSTNTIKDAFVINNIADLTSAQAYYTTPSTASWINSSVVTLNNGTAYYARFVDENTISLYDTLAHANAGGTTGLVYYSSTGSTATSTFFIDSVLAPTLVKAILHIEKPASAGYISLYAFDRGRTNSLALIGQYHPSETNPKYRRIRIGKTAAWARIIYRTKAPEITSVYDYIPLENSRAILAALHACDLEDKDFIEQSQKYWQVAIAYLHNQNESMEGHAMMPPQINGLTYGDQTDPVIDSDFYGY